jgi:carbonic anhydrase
MQRIVEGVKRFQREVFPEKSALFQNLASGQKPQALFITCGDSRVLPSLITQTDPGELFILRNAGNIVPPFGSMLGGMSASIEYAVVALDVRHIIICGHSDCGAMKGILHPEWLVDMPTVSEWLHQAEAARRVVVENYPQLTEKEKLHVLTRENVLAQLGNLKTHPSVAARIARGSLNIYGWVYTIATGHIEAYDDEHGEFVQLDVDRIANATPRPRQMTVAGAGGRQ